MRQAIELNIQSTSEPKSDSTVIEYPREEEVNCLIALRLLASFRNLENQALPGFACRNGTTLRFVGAGRRYPR